MSHSNKNTDNTNLQMLQIILLYVLRKVEHLKK